MTGTICNELVVTSASQKSSASTTVSMGLIVGCTVGAFVAVVVLVALVMKKKKAAKIAAEQEREIQNSILQKQLEEEALEEARRNEILRRGNAIVAKPSRWRVASHVMSVVRAMSARSTKSRKRIKVEEMENDNADQESRLTDGSAIEKNNDNESFDIDAKDFVNTINIGSPEDNDDEGLLDKEIEEILS